MSEFRSNIAIVKGLGSAKDGTSHWWKQRLSAIFIAPLLLWFVYSMACVIGNHSVADIQPVMEEWFKNPLKALLAIVAIAGTYYHALLGLQVVIEDYMHSKSDKFTMLILTKFFIIIFGAATVLAILKLHFT